MSASHCIQLFVSNLIDVLSIYFPFPSYILFPLILLLCQHHTDLCIESLVVRGAMLMARFLQGEPSDSFSWLNPSGYIGSAKQLGRLPGNNSSIYDDDTDEFSGPKKKTRGSRWRTVVISSTAVAAFGGVGWYFLKDEHKDTVRSFITDFTKKIKLNAFKFF